jgi:hypothetical protein
MNEMKTCEAKIQKPPGWDVYRSDHIIYINKDNEVGGALRVLHQAYIIFCDSSLIQLIHHRNVEIRKFQTWMQNGGNITNGDMPDAPALRIQAEKHHLDMFKIGTAFELAIKSNLLLAGYVIHRIKKIIVNFIFRAAKGAIEDSKAE